MSQSPERIREFVIAGHGSLEKVQTLLSETPELLNLAHEWRPGDTETAIQGAAHVGNRAIAEYLLEQGALLEIWTALMLGQSDQAKHMLAQNPELAHAKSAHGISTLAHAALSGKTELLELLAQHKALEGPNLALSLAVSKGHAEAVRWLLEHTQTDPNWKNFQGKTVLEQALESGQTEIVQLLEQR